MVGNEVQLCTCGLVGGVVLMMRFADCWRDGAIPTAPLGYTILMLMASIVNDMMLLKA